MPLSLIHQNNVVSIQRTKACLSELIESSHLGSLQKERNLERPSEDQLGNLFWPQVLTFVFSFQYISHYVNVFLGNTLCRFPPNYIMGCDYVLLSWLLLTFRSSSSFTRAWYRAQANKLQINKNNVQINLTYHVVLHLFMVTCFRLKSSLLLEIVVLNKFDDVAHKLNTMTIVIGLCTLLFL